jgi:hypothetical protein
MWAQMKREGSGSMKTKKITTFKWQFLLISALVLLGPLLPMLTISELLEKRQRGLESPATNQVEFPLPVKIIYTASVLAYPIIATRIALHGVGALTGAAPTDGSEERSMLHDHFMLHGILGFLFIILCGTGFIVGAVMPPALQSAFAFGFLWSFPGIVYTYYQIEYLYNDNGFTEEQIKKHNAIGLYVCEKYDEYDEFRAAQKAFVKGSLVVLCVIVVIGVFVLAVLDGFFAIR